MESLKEQRGAVALAASNGWPADLEAAAADPFWDTLEIEETRWDKQFPYQLLLVQAVGQGVYQERQAYTLPIPPQSITESWPFAVTTGALLGGVFEEHNGVPFRNFVLQGTTGVVPGRGVGTALQTPNPLQSIFAGTVQAATQAVASVGATLGGQRPAPNLIQDSEIGDAISAGSLTGTTGYFQHLTLKRFLESYANLKKKSVGRPYRLALAIWKTGEVFLVSPITFDSVKDSGSPHRWRWTLSLKAWRRITLGQGFGGQGGALVGAVNDPGLLAAVLGKVDDARQTLSSAKAVLEAVRADVDASLFEVLRETSFFCRDALGVALTAADLPVNVARDARAAILEAAGSLSSASAVDAALSSIPERTQAEIRDTILALRQYSVTSGKSLHGASGPPLDSGDPDPGAKILDDPQAQHALFSAIKVGDLRLRPSTSKAILRERERVREFTRVDFEARRDALVTLVADVSDALGAGSESYNAALGRAPPPTGRVPTGDDFETIFALNLAVQQLDSLAAVNSPNPAGSLTVEEYVAGLASGSGIPFKVPASKRLVPFPYGSTLERVAARYLGDPDRWHELAILNDLREPFVDEEGFDLPLLANASGSELVVSSAADLYVGQPIWLASATASRTRRHIVGIQVGPGSATLTLDGDPDLASYKLQDGAVIHTFLPGTVNSAQMIAIPDDSPPDVQELAVRGLPGLDQSDNFLQVGGVDLMVTSSGDAAITPDGDWKLAVGLANLNQRLLTFVRTPRGSLLHDPDYGFNLQPGQSTADVSAQQAADALRSLTVFDPAFTAVKSVSVLKSGPTAQVYLEVGLQGVRHRLPVAFEVVR